MPDGAARSAFGLRKTPPDAAPQTAFPTAVETPSAPAPAAAPARDSAYEHRIVPRARTLQSARLLLGEGTDGIDCAVRDLSIAGAGVRIPPDTELPEAMRLLLIREGLLFDCEVIWRLDDRAGLRFTGRHDLNGDTSGELDAIHALWRELASG